MALILEQNAATVEEALAFIDSCVASDDDDDFLSGSVDGLDAVGLPAVPTPRAPSVNRSRERRRAELEALRTQVKQLDAQLQHLQRVSNSIGKGSGRATATSAPLVKMWMEMALRQHRQREKAELTNRQLRHLLARQIKVARYMESALFRRANLEGKDLVFGGGLGDRRLASIDVHFTELAGGVADVLADFERCLDATRHRGEAGSADLTQSAKAGLAVTIIHSVPLPYDRATTAAALWSFVTSVAVQTDRYYQSTLTVDGDNVSKDYTVAVEGQHSDASLRGKAVVKRFDKADSVAVAWRSKVLMATNEFELHVNGCMALAGSLDARASILHTYHYFEVAAPGGIPKDRRDAAQQLLDKFICAYDGKTEASNQAIDNILLSQP